MDIKNLLLIGTSHIARQSIKEVTDSFRSFNPDILAVELDQKRLYSLMSKNKVKIRVKDIFRVGFRGYLFALFGAWAEKKLGDYVGINPGSDMLAGVKLAKTENKMIAFIDQNIEITLKHLSKGISWKEKWNFLVDIIKAVIFRKREVEFDLRTVPDEKIIITMINKVKVRYPNIYRILIKERNETMAKNILKVMLRFPEKRILCIVGAGHKEEILKILKRKLDRFKEPVTYTFNVS